MYTERWLGPAKKIPEHMVRKLSCCCHRQCHSCWLGFCSFLGLFYAVSSSPHDFFFTVSDDLLTFSKNVAVKVSFVFVVWKEPCK